MQTTQLTRTQSKYSRKKLAQKNGSYHGSSPFFNNIREFQFLKPLHLDLYPHLRVYNKFRLPSKPVLRSTSQEADIDVG